MSRFLRRFLLSWMLVAFLAVLARAEELALSAQDRAWLQNNPKVAFSYDPDWPPFSYRNSAGEMSGLDADMLRFLGARLGIEFVPVHAPNWSSAYALALKGKVQVLTSTARTPEREDAFLFTRPYVGFSIAIITRSEEPAFDDLICLIGKRVAVPRGHAPSLALQRDFPELKFVACETVTDALELVVTNQADVALTNLVNARHVIHQKGLIGLKVAGVAPYEFHLRLAVSRSAPELHRALEAVLASLSQDERHSITAPYVAVDDDAVVSWRRATRWFWIVCAIAALLIAGVAWHSRSLKRELEKRRHLQAELEDSRDRLAKLNDEKNGLMQMAAHDLKNPLAAVLLGIDLLRLSGDSGQEKTLNRMVSQVNQVLHLIHDLLDVQALETGSRQFQSEPIAIGSAVHESLATLQTAAERKSIALHATIAEPSPIVYADRSALRQICDNLISNAIKFSPQGGRIAVAVTQTDRGLVRLSVRDNGKGIRPEEMARLFEKYSCLSTRPTAGEASTGLGLSIVKELTLRVGGRVWCESQGGEGATFLVELPTQPTPPVKAS